MFYFIFFFTKLCLYNIKVAVDALCIILKLVKPPKETRVRRMIDVINQQTNGKINESEIALNLKRPGFRADNSWHLYEPNFLSNFYDYSEADEKKWTQTEFLDKSYWGYYCWPNQIKTVVNKRAKFGSGKFDKAIQPVKERFTNDPHFIEKFIALSTIEESRGNEKFEKKRFYLFKSLFRNFGCTEIFNGVYEHLTRLIKDRESKTHECSHKFAAELLSGLIRGSKYWPLEQLKQLWTRLKIILDLVMENVTTETVKLWTACFSTISEDQDPRRMTFYLNYLFDFAKNLFKQNDAGEVSATSFQQSSFLQIIGSSLNQMEWRIPSFWSDLLSIFLANMSHPYKAIREKNST